MYSHRKTTMTLLLVFLGAISQAISAQGQEVYMKEEATQQEYIDALKMTRSIRPVSTGENQNESADDQVQATAVSVKVYFEYGSSKLTAEARQELDNLGAALASAEFSAERWIIEGHTDSGGSKDYNQVLSEQRAVSVQNYLTIKFGLDSDQLVPVGKGEDELYDKRNPRSGVNRRVRIKYLGG